MNGRTNAVGSEGKTVSKTATLIIETQVGSTVTLYKSGVVTKVFSPSEGIILSSTPSIIRYYYSILPSNFGEYTIDKQYEISVPTVSNTITISENKIYYMDIRVPVYLYKAGDLCTNVTGGWKQAVASGSGGWSRADATFNDSNITFSLKGATKIGGVSTNNKITGLGATTLHINVTAYSAGSSSYRVSTGGYSTANSYSSLNSDGAGNKLAGRVNLTSTGEKLLSLPSTLDHYITILCSNNNLTVSDIWLT